MSCSDVEVKGSGPFLLILRDEHEPGGFAMRRFQTRREALIVCFNYGGSAQEWLFEVSETIDLEAESAAFLDGIAIK